LVHVLEARADEQVRLFSRLRDRQVLLSVLDWPLSTAVFSEWVALEPHQQRAVGHFADAVESLRWYATYTEDMPGQVALQLAAHRGVLREKLVGLEAALEPPATKLQRVVDVAKRRRASRQVK
jgi:hypothetical protein